MARRISKARARQSAGLLIAGGVIMLLGAGAAASVAQWAQAAVAFVVSAYFIGSGIQRWRDAEHFED